MILLANVYGALDTRRDASRSIAGYHYQFLVTIEHWLNLGPRDKLYVELAEDNLIVKNGVPSFEQVKRVGSIKIGAIRQFVARALDIWEESETGAKLGFRLITTADPPGDRSSAYRLVNWIKGYKIDGRISNSPRDAITDLSSVIGQRIGNKFDKELVEFLGSIDLDFGAVDIDGKHKNLKAKINSRFSELDAQQLLESLYWEVTNRIVRPGVGDSFRDKLITRDDLDKLAAGLAERDESKRQYFEASLVPAAIDLMGQSLDEFNPERVIGHSELARGLIENQNNELQFNYYKTLGGAHSQLQSDKEADYWRRAESVAVSQPEALYCRGRVLLADPNPDISAIQGLAEEVIHLDGDSRNGYLLMLSGPVEDMVQFALKIPKHLHSDPSLAKLVAFGLLRVGKLNESLVWAKCSRDSTVLIRCRLAQLLKLTWSGRDCIPSRSARRLLLKWRNDFQVAWDRLKDRASAKRSNLHILNGLAVVGLFLDSGDYPARLCELVEIDNSPDNQLHRIMLLRLGGHDTEANKAQESLDSESDPRFFNPPVDSDIAARVAGIIGVPTKFLYGCDEAFLGAMVYKLKPDKLGEVVDLIGASPKSLPAKLLGIVKAKNQQDKLEMVKAILDQALIDKQGPSVLATLLAELDEFGGSDVALDYLAKLNSKHFFDQADLEIISRLEGEDLYRQLEGYLSKFGPIKEVLERKLELDLDAKDYRAALRGMKSLIKLDPDDLRTRIRVVSLMAIQNHRETKAFARKAIDQHSQKPGSYPKGISLELVQVLLEASMPVEATDILYRIRRDSPGNREVGVLAFQIMEQSSYSFKKRWVNWGEVADQCIVELQRGSGEKLIRIVEADIPDDELKKDECNKASDFYKQVIGKEVGHQTKDYGRISTIHHKYQSLFRDAMADPDRRPPGLVAHQGSDIDELRDVMVEVSKRSDDAWGEALGIYKQSSGPMSWLAKVNSRSLADVFYTVIESDDLLLHCGVNADEEDEQFQRALSDLNNNGGHWRAIALDFSALLTLHWLGLLDTLLSLTDRIITSVQTVEEVNGAFDPVEIDKSRLADFRAVKDWLDKNVSKCPSRAVIELSKDDKDTLETTGGIPSFATIALAREPGVVAISDELSFRAYGISLAGALCLPTNRLLELMRLVEAIDCSVYADSTVKMIKAGYRQISIGPNLLVSCVSVNRPEDLNFLLSRLIGDGQSQLQVVAGILADFLIGVHENTVLGPTSIMAAQSLLRVLMRHVYDAGGSLRQAIERSLDSKLIYNPILRRNIAWSLNNGVWPPLITPNMI